eukprot:239752-Chlamydomonas_euryale.AAC.1
MVTQAAGGAAARTCCDGEASSDVFVAARPFRAAGGGSLAIERDPARGLPWRALHAGGLTASDRRRRREVPLKVEGAQCRARAA